MYEIGLWGPSAAGKTAFLLQLFNHAGREEWQVYANEGADKLLRHARSYTDQNRFPPATPAQALPDRVAYILTNRTTQQEYTVSLEDRPGGELTKMADETATALNAASGLLLFMPCDADPITLRNSLHHVLTALDIAAKRGSLRDLRPVAICLTKVDRKLQVPEDLSFAIEDPSAFVRCRIDSTLESIAEHHLGNYTFFPVSAAGVRVYRGVLWPSTFLDERLELRLARDGTPINLLTPLKWIAAQLSTGGLRV